MRIGTVAGNVRLRYELPPLVVIPGLFIYLTFDSDETVRSIHSNRFDSFLSAVSFFVFLSVDDIYGARGANSITHPGIDDRNVGCACRWRSARRRAPMEQLMAKGQSTAPRRTCRASSISTRPVARRTGTTVTAMTRRQTRTACLNILNCKQ